MYEDEIEHEEELTRDEVADHLEAFADNLRGDGETDLVVGDKTVTVNPPESVEYEVEIEDEGEVVGEDVTREIEFELEWDRQEDEEDLDVD